MRNVLVLWIREINRFNADPRAKYYGWSPEKVNKNSSFSRTEGSRTPYFYLYILASIVYSIYTYMWDIKVQPQLCGIHCRYILFAWICNFCINTIPYLPLDNIANIAKTFVRVQVGNLGFDIPRTNSWT
jgi:hypothetical protein